jgi:prepilin-type N-terminal cleavage/methylation domain-containing protein
MKRNGFTLIELIMAMTLGCMIMLIVATLVVSGQKSWKKSYDKANCQSQLDSIGAISSFGGYGRKSNKKDYYVYSVSGTNFTQVMPVSNPEENLTGQAVEFRYWSSDVTANMLTPTSKADCYALFYLDNTQPANVKLMLDVSDPTLGGFGPPAINTSRHRATGTGITTVILASYVYSVAFTHTTKDMAGDGYGSVRMRLVINNPADGGSKTFLAATCLRNTWPE